MSESEDLQKKLEKRKMLEKLTLHLIDELEIILSKYIEIPEVITGGLLTCLCTNYLIVKEKDPQLAVKMMKQMEAALKNFDAEEVGTAYIKLENAEVVKMPHYSRPR